MTTFETLILMFYMVFAFGYMINALGIDETDSIWFRIFLIFIALTLGILWFPMVFGSNIYDKLHK